MTVQTRMPVLYELLTGEIGNARKRALEDLTVAMHGRETQAKKRAFDKAKRLTCQALERGA